MTIEDKPVKHRCDHKWVYYISQNEQVCTKCGIHETPPP